MFTAIIATVLAIKPDFPINLITVWLGVASAILAAIGIVGVTGVIPKVAQAKAVREINARMASRGDMQGRGQAGAAGTPAGVKAFFAYRTAVGNKTHDGKDIPMWDDLTDTVRHGWAAAEAAGRVA